MKGSGKAVDWKGCGTALVTPFDEKGRIDFGALEAIVDEQIVAGVDFLVPCGTTGESATLSRDERKAVTAAVVRAANGRAPVVAGAGGNHTARAVFWARDAAAAKADGILSVTPMYNRPSPEGLVRHFSAIADATDLPILVGNEPGRTAMDLDVETILRLSEIPRVAGLKEASTDFGKIARLMAAVPRGLRGLRRRGRDGARPRRSRRAGPHLGRRQRDPEGDVRARARGPRGSSRRGPGAPAQVPAADGNELPRIQSRDPSSARSR